MPCLTVPSRILLCSASARQNGQPLVQALWFLLYCTYVQHKMRPPPPSRQGVPYGADSAPQTPGTSTRRDSYPALELTHRRHLSELDQTLHSVSRQASSSRDGPAGSPTIPVASGRRRA